MGDWEEITEMFGLDAGASWEQLERRMNGGNVEPPLGAFECRVLEALKAAGAEGEPTVRTARGGLIEFQLLRGGVFALKKSENGGPWTWLPRGSLGSQECLVADALYTRLTDLRPADGRYWRADGEAEFASGYRAKFGDEVRFEHSYLRTRVVQVVPVDSARGASRLFPAVIELGYCPESPRPVLLGASGEYFEFKGLFEHLNRCILGRLG